LAANRRPESDAVIVKDSGKKRFVVPANVLARRFAAAVRRQNAIFGAGEPPARLYGMGPYRGLLGTSVGAQVRSGGGKVSLDPVRPSDLMQVSGSVPPTVNDVAVASGRRIVAVVPAAGGRFWALVPRSGYRASRALAVYAIDGPARAPRLTRLRAR
jgi:hypothetical protein